MIPGNVRTNFVRNFAPEKKLFFGSVSFYRHAALTTCSEDVQPARTPNPKFPYQGFVQTKALNRKALLGRTWTDRQTASTVISRQFSHILRGTRFAYKECSSLTQAQTENQQTWGFTGE